MQVRRTTETRNALFIVGDILEDIAGGVTLNNDFDADIDSIAGGTLVGEDPDTDGLYHVQKTAEAYEDSADTSLKVLKAHVFKVGDYICNGTVSTLITAIDHDTATDNDDITLTAGMTVLDGHVLYLSTSEGTEVTDIAQKYTPVGFTRYEVIYGTYGEFSGRIAHTNITVGVIVRGTVRESLLPYKMYANAKLSLTDRIRFA